VSATEAVAPGIRPRDVGVAFSGGGSRAAAFHCGTLRALERLGLLDRVATVSSVSGGSVFAAGWLSSIKLKERTADFLQRITGELRKGFVLRALMSPRVFGLLWPGYNRTDLLAGAFQRLCGSLKLGELPAIPALCINVSVLNSGQVGRFSKNGFSTFGLGPLEAGSNAPVACDAFPLARAAAASAAFPVGLPPIYLRKRRWFADVRMMGDLEGQSMLALSDGGVIENLGTQTLLKSRTFGTPHIIASDAGTKQPAWRPGNPFYWARSFVMWLLSGSILERFALVMSDKQSRWMREELFHEATGHLPRSRARRNILLARVNADWETLVGGVRPERLAELTPGDSAPLTSAAGEEALAKHAWGRADLLAEAKEGFNALGMKKKQLNGIGTHFFGMPKEELDALARHSYWQVLAAFAIYWEPWPADGLPPVQDAEPRAAR
jgi:predicted acylesterase/phospholipase RssA